MNEETVRPPVSRAQVLGVTLGNALEFYDFLVFSFFAKQIGEAFFPNPNPGESLLAALGTFGAGFLTRPIGAIVLGRLGDRVGRKPAMLVSFVLIGASSLGVALVPPFAVLGVAAPILVIGCRLVQGFALGGEVGASTAFLVEAAPAHRRGLYAALQSASQNAATLVAGIVGVALASAMDEAALASWGWRLALGLGVLIVPVGLVLRSSLPETMAAEIAAEPPPPLASYARDALLAFLLLLSGTIVTYVMNYMATYAKAAFGLPSAVAFGATVAVGLAGVIAAIGGGILSDVYGRKPLMFWPLLAATVLVLPGFWLVGRWPGAWTLWPVSFVVRFGLAASFAVALAQITESFPARVRSGVLALVYAVAISVFGGSTQFAVEWLRQETGSAYAPAWMMLVAAAIGLVAIHFARETAPGKVSLDKTNLLR